MTAEQIRKCGETLIWLGRPTEYTCERTAGHSGRHQIDDDFFQVEWCRHEVNEPADRHAAA